jgi:hypothetical protein
MALAEVTKCTCEGCAAMRREYGKDPDLLAFYTKRLLVRGWAKQLSESERLYLSNHSAWYQANQEKGRRLAANYPRNRHAAPPDPVPQKASGVEADLDTTPRKLTRKRKGT